MRYKVQHVELILKSTWSTFFILQALSYNLVNLIKYQQVSKEERVMISILFNQEKSSMCYIA